MRVHLTVSVSLRFPVRLFKLEQVNPRDRIDLSPLHFGHFGPTCDRGRCEEEIYRSLLRPAAYLDLLCPDVGRSLLIFDRSRGFRGYQRPRREGSVPRPGTRWHLRGIDAVEKSRERFVLILRHMHATEVIRDDVAHPWNVCDDIGRERPCRYLKC